MACKIQQVKITQLESAENLDNQDFILVSEYEDGKYHSKKLSLELLSQFICEAISQDEKIEGNIKGIVSDSVKRAIKEEGVDEDSVKVLVSEAVKRAIKEEAVDGVLSLLETINQKLDIIIANQ